jgi:hypothetical protein
MIIHFISVPGRTHKPTNRPAYSSPLLVHPPATLSLSLTGPPIRFFPQSSTGTAPCSCMLHRRESRQRHPASACACHLAAPHRPVGHCCVASRAPLGQPPSGKNHRVTSAAFEDARPPQQVTTRFAYCAHAPLALAVVSLPHQSASWPDQSCPSNPGSRTIRKTPRPFVQPPRLSYSPSTSRCGRTTPSGEP